MLFRNLRDLPEIYDRRLAACNKLESAEATLIGLAAKLKLKADKEAGKDTQAPKASTKAGTNKTSTGPDGSGSSLAIDSPLVTPSESGEAGHKTRVEEFVPREKRPTHKLGFLGLWGEKVDTIEWCRKEIATCTELLEAGKLKIRESDAEEGVHHDVDIFAGAAVDEYGNPIGLSRQNHTFDDDGNLNVSGVVKDVSGKVVGGVKGAVGGVKDASGKVVSGVLDVGGKVVNTVTGKNKSNEYEPLNSAFVTFNKQIAAHLAVQALAHHKPYRMGESSVSVA